MALRRTKGEAELPGKGKLDLFLWEYKSGHKNFFMGWNAGMEELVTKYNLSGMELRLFILMIAKMDYCNLVQYSLQEMAKFLGSDRAVLNRAALKLKEHELIKVGRTVQRVKFYRVNPYMAAKVRDTAHQELIKDWDEAE